MKEITIGIAAHVDAGKTTLSEALLYETGQVRKLGRVDHGDTVLDSDELEKKRGITIFSHEAQLKKDDFKINLLDTPGHIDFANQTEQVFDVVDYAILVISASDGVTSYTRTLWNLLADRQVPVFIFVNKMDNAGVEKTAILQQIQEQLDNNCVDFTAEDDDFYENVATCDEQVLEQYLDQNTLSAAVIQDLIQKRATFPVYFGSALKVKGIATFFAGLEKWTKAKPTDDQFAARIFKISHDQKGERLTWLKLLGGQLQTKAELNQEKVNQIRSYNGAKFAVVPEIKAGQLATVTGPVKTYPGQGLGINDSPHASLRPVLTYQVQPKQGDLYAVLDALKLLEDENPQLHVQWNEELQEIHVQIMGAIQLEVLQQILLKRFNLQVSFNQGSILYQETILNLLKQLGILNHCAIMPKCICYWSQARQIVA